MTSGSRAGAVLASCLIVAMGAAACGGTSASTKGGGGAAGPTGGATGASSTPGGGGAAPSGGTVHFAAVGALSGIQAAVGQPILEGAKAAAVVINAAGGILGKKLVIDPTDTKGDPADAGTAIRQEFAVNHPAVMIGPATISIHGAQPVFDDAKVPDGWNGGSAAFDNNPDPYLWRCNASDSQEGVAVAAYAATKGYKRAAMYFTTIAASQAFEPIISTEFNKLGGTVVDTENVTAGLSSYRTEVSRLIAAKPDVIFMQAEPATAATTMKDFKQLGGLNIPIVATDLMAGSDVIKAVGPVVDAKHFVMVQGSSELTGASVAFAKAYQTANNKAPEAGAGYAYDCTIDFALAITAGKSFKSADIETNMLKVSNPPGVKVSDYATGVADLAKGMDINYDGVSGPLDFNTYHNVNGPWDIVVADGSAAGNTKVVETLQPAQIQDALNGKLPS